MYQEEYQEERENEIERDIERKEQKKNKTSRDSTYSVLCAYMENIYFLF